MGKDKEKIQWKNQFVNLLAIIVGVYVAFYLTERSAQANSRKQARTYLASMADDLENDIKNLQTSTDTLVHILKASQSLTKSIITQKIPKDSIQDMIRILYLIVPFSPQDNSYQSLKTSGKLDAIDNNDLRKKITELYYQHYGAIRITDDITNQQRTSLILPYLMKNLQFRANGLQNYEQLWKDNMFANISFTVQYAQAMKYQLDSEALTKAKALKLLILAELEK